MDEIKDSKGVNFDTELTADDLKEVIQKFKQVYKDKMGTDFPQEPKVQLMEAVKAVFRSWDNDRAIVYRRMNDIPGDWGTAVNVWATLPEQVWHLPEIRPPVQRVFMGNI